MLLKKQNIVLAVSDKTHNIISKEEIVMIVKMIPNLKNRMEKNACHLTHLTISQKKQRINRDKHNYRN